MNESMAEVSKIRIVENTTVNHYTIVQLRSNISIEQYHIVPTGAKHRAREATSLRSRQGARSAVSRHTTCASNGLWALRYLIGSLSDVARAAGHLKGSVSLLNIYRAL